MRHYFVIGHICIKRYKCSNKVSLKYDIAVLKSQLKKQTKKLSSCFKSFSCGRWIFLVVAICQHHRYSKLCLLDSQRALPA